MTGFVNRLVSLCALTAALSLGGLSTAIAQAAAQTPAASPTTVDDILEQAAKAEAAAEPSEEDAETRGVPAGPIPYNNLGSADELDKRIRGASAAAQTLQGPLDGRWSLATSDGVQLYTFLFVDSGRGALEGAWRDVTRGEGLTATGVIDNLRRDGGVLNASFDPRSGQQVSLNLSQLTDGSWSGDLDQGGQRRAVRLLRAEPLLDSAPMFGAAGTVSPYRTSATRPAAVRAAPARASKKAVKKKGARSAASKKKAPARKSARKRT
jgi:hypothetical protein